jgi:hypothetical protein
LEGQIREKMETMGNMNVSLGVIIVDFTIGDCEAEG